MISANPLITTRSSFRKSAAFRWSLLPPPPSLPRTQSSPLRSLVLFVRPVETPTEAPTEQTQKITRKYKSQDNYVACQLFPVLNQKRTWLGQVYLPAER